MQWQFIISITIYHRELNQCSSHSSRKINQKQNFFVFANDQNCYFLSANAVQAMVSKDIVHRDLKPQNILMNHEGRSVKNPQPQDIRLKIGKINMNYFFFKSLKKLRFKPYPIS